MKYFLTFVLTAFLFCASTMFSTPVALADGQTIDTVIEFNKKLPSSDLYSLYRGFIETSLYTLKWGGSHCTGITVPTEAELALIAAAAQEGRTFTFYYKTVSSNYCLVGFEIRYY